MALNVRITSSLHVRKLMSCIVLMLQYWQYAVNDLFFLFCSSLGESSVVKRQEKQINSSPKDTGLLQLFLQVGKKCVRKQKSEASWDLHGRTTGKPQIGLKMSPLSIYRAENVFCVVVSFLLFKSRGGQNACVSYIHRSNIRIKYSYSFDSLLENDGHFIMNFLSLNYS